MSTVAKITDEERTWMLAEAGRPPFQIGYRSVPRTLPNGEVTYDRIPLTVEDLLFPQEEDREMLRPEHVEDCVYLKCCLDLLMAHVPESVVTMECRVDFNIPGVEPLGPDVAVFLNVRDNWNNATLEVGEDSARPLVVFEVTSPDSRPNDLDRKPEFYYQAHVPCYVVLDSRYKDDHRVDLHLIGFRHTPTGYEPISLDDQGRLWVEPLSSWLKVVDNRVVVIESQTGQPIDAPLDQIFARRAAEARADAQAQNATEANARAAEANARADAEAQVAAEANARADAKAQVAAEANARADAEAQVAAAATARADAAMTAQLALEAQMAAMQAELRRLKGEE